MTAATATRVRTADGTRLHVEVAGSGDTLLLLTGIGYATWAWQRQLPEFSRRYRTVAFDSRGVGRSDKPDERYTIELCAEDALAVLDAVGSRPAHVLGFSMGGYVALTLALRHPDAVRSLVLVATSCGGPDSLGVPEATLEAWGEAAHLSPEEFARRTMPLAFAPGWATAHPEEFEAALAARLAHPTPAFAWRRQFVACAEFLAEGIDAESIRQPALVLHGTLDRIVPLENSFLLARRLPRAELAILEEAGHLALLERPADVNRRILEFLERAA